MDNTAEIEKMKQTISELEEMLARARERLSVLQDRPLDHPRFSTRVKTFLCNERIETYRQLASIRELDLLRTPNLGRKSIREIEAILSEVGLQLSR